jgi:hypothetical protein
MLDFVGIQTSFGTLIFILKLSLKRIIHSIGQNPDPPKLDYHEDYTHKKLTIRTLSETESRRKLQLYMTEIVTVKNRSRKS